jgi:hypothetical protein
MPCPFIMNSFVKSLLNVIPRGLSTPSCLLNTISRNVPSGDTNNTKDNKIDIGEWCHGVTAGKDKIYIGGRCKVIILNTDGSRLREITTDYKNPSSTKYKNPSSTKYKNLSFTKYKNLSFTTIN